MRTRPISPGCLHNTLPVVLALPLACWAVLYGVVQVAQAVFA